MPKNWMCPILPLNKNYLRNYKEPKNYLEVPEWQDDSSWSGNCRKIHCAPFCPKIEKLLRDTKIYLDTEVLIEKQDDS
jgi:hypothetical protein